MSEQTLDLKTSLRIIRRHWIWVSAIVAIGLIAGAGYAYAKPSKYASSAIVALPTNTRDLPTQVVVAGSQDVLASAARTLGPPFSISTLRTLVDVNEVTSNLLSVNARGSTAAQAERIANDVATSYVRYVGTNKSVAGKIPAAVFEYATNATRTPVPVHFAEFGVLGLLAGLLVGSLVTLAINRTDRRLRRRDEIADAIGVGVLAAVPVARPKEPAGWAELLQSYHPSPLYEWRLLNMLSYMGMFERSAHPNREQDISLTILSLASDQKALAIGPQLAAFAAAKGVKTALVIGPEGGTTHITAALRTACAAPSTAAALADHLQVAVADQADLELRPDARLTVVVAVVDVREPRPTRLIRTSATVLAVSAGAATPEQLATLATSAAADGHQIEGILVADPDPGDHTTGQIPQLASPTQRATPTRLTGTTGKRR
jgi:capsular polysaccharide biosynthesis protein